MALTAIGAGFTLLLAFLTLREKARRNRVVGLIQSNPVTTIADLVQTFPAHSDPSTGTHAAVQGCVVARETTRLTAPITGSSCVAYQVRVYTPGDIEHSPDTNHIVDSKSVPWAVNDGTGLALADFNPFEDQFERRKGFQGPYHWPGTESTGGICDTPHDFAIGPSDKERLQSLSRLPGRKHEDPSPSPLNRIISHYGRECLPTTALWEDLSWEVSILKEFGNEVFLLGPYTVQDGCAHFQLGSDSILWFGSRADALSSKQLSLQCSAKWVVIWLTLSFILAVAYLYFG